MIVVIYCCYICIICAHNFLNHNSDKYFYINFFYCIFRNTLALSYNNLTF